MYNCRKDNFYIDALEIFSNAGLTDSSNPVFDNHSLDRFVYYDCPNIVALTKWQRKILNCIDAISLLFTINGDAFERFSQEKINFYSAELICFEANRSQVAVDVHSILSQIIDCDASVFLFKHDENIMISIIGFQQECILSDWYSIYDHDDLLDKLDILNVRLDTAKHFFFDLVFSVAREYYVHPISKEQAMYCSLPDDYFQKNPDVKLSREELKEIIDETLNYYVNKYGSDYVYEDQYSVVASKSDDAELDLLLLSLNSDDIDNEPESPYGETVVEPSIPSEDDTVNDDFDFSNFDPELFKDPILLVKWLENHSGNTS